MRELRCEGNKLHGLVEEEPVASGVVEFRCTSRFCKTPGVVVLHRFDLSTGELSTRRYKDTPSERGMNGASDKLAAVRNA